MADAEIREKLDPALRLPRQAEHYSQIVGHFLAVKNSKEIAGAIQAHFERLQKYHNASCSAWPPTRRRRGDRNGSTDMTSRSSRPPPSAPPSCAR